jgi:outer membrane protein assembly factor BamD
MGVVLVCLLCVGCAGREEKSELLSLLGVDEKITDTSDEGAEKVYDALTLLKRGEADYVKEDYIAASDEYLRFLEMHPFHRMAAFAQYRLGMSYYSQMGTNDRDSGPMEKAFAAFQKVVTLYPQSLYVDEAGAKIRELTHRQAERDFYVGYFYYKNDAYPAAIARFIKVLTKEEKGPIAEKSLYYMGLSHYYFGSLGAAKATLERLLAEYPDGDYSRKGKQLLSQIESAPSSS